MKVILLLLVASSICRIVCPTDKYNTYEHSISCSLSLCHNDGCDGTDICKKCPNGIIPNTHNCAICNDNEGIPINKVCKPCSLFKAADHSGRVCICNSGIADCCTQPGVYKDDTDCIPCSPRIVGCAELN